MPAGELGVLGDDLAVGVDHNPALAPLHLNRATDESEGHRVAVGIEADQEVLRHDPRIPGLEPERGLVRRREQVVPLGGEARNGPLMRRAVDPLIGDRHRPVEERVPEMNIVHELAAHQEVPLEGPSRPIPPCPSFERDRAGRAGDRSPSTARTLERWGPQTMPSPLGQHTVRGRSYRCSLVWPPKWSKARSWASRKVGSCSSRQAR